MTNMMTLSSTPTIVLDWPSLVWTMILAGLTFSCLAIKSRFSQIAQQGAVARVLAHVVVGYFSVGMMVFGASSAARSHFPVPGGSAWEGPIAVVGGLAALVIGSTTLVEHVMSVREAHRSAVLERAPSHD